MRCALWFCVLLLLCPALGYAADPPDQPAGDRPFLMGFTAFPPDFTPQAVLSTRKFVKENADLIAHPIEGLRGTESPNDQPFPPAFVKEWEDKKLATPPKGKVYLPISPGRGDLKPAEKSPAIPK